MKDVFKFNYKGYTFVPVGQINPKMSSKVVSLYLENTEMDCFKCYGNSERGWSYNDFYDAATSKCDTCDVFYCEETEEYYIPGEKELFIWNGGFYRIQVED